ncbi:cytidine deaminase [Chitinophaga polysaccharea]|uniref:cytidine deaminase n=1 Tax=Chitinophaga TaxID=79328 RepID=UPI001455BD6B|nr:MULTISPECIES: cytidine deaminase [Chitinophaga]NLR57248.1 cytidine deaminase [Chitinophaga polysaccharea]NLU91634.1 cytidine deaminase [Chitinophaga sp. Ak27]
MEKQQLHIDYIVYNDINGLEDADAWLLKEAREVTAHAYAPYSHFQVGAVIRLANGEIVAGTNQENASFPIGLCAERVALASAASVYPNVDIDTIAISYHNLKGDSGHPISPCGMCRQALAEYEMKQEGAIRLILGGLSGRVYVINHANDLLPLSFSGEELG